MTAETIWWLILIGATLWIILLVLLPIARRIKTPTRYSLQRELDLRLTYKRYKEIYRSTQITYPEYKRMQAERAYKKAVSSTKNKRMVR